ncbi:Fe-Mn family superoxide dismutase [Sphingobium psychrophilum]|uniref:Fe-Mn family superoxide dismutase n=1 Tax=Sphingobium psychrophilum TaxID=2728834 RepID=UPI002E2ADF0D|nr:Fe-Mn family superoxide dismutase [Sphingobium psychrophilum]
MHGALAKAWGSFETWEKDFRRTGLSLAGGSGWMILAYNLHIHSLHNHWVWDHMHGAAAGIPILALDMYEHSFHMDHGRPPNRCLVPQSRLGSGRPALCAGDSSRHHLNAVASITVD